jgi:hypothetical protein
MSERRLPAKLGSLRERQDRVLKSRSLGVPVATVRRFFEINGLRKSMLIAFNLVICGLPLLMIVFSLLSNGRENMRLGTVVVQTFELQGQTAEVMRELFASNDSVLGLASAIVLLTLLVSGFDIADAIASAYGDAFRTRKIHGITGQLRGFLWFALSFAHFGVSMLLLRKAAALGIVSWLIAIPFFAWISWHFWLLTPRLMLDRKLDRADLVPGAWLGMIASTGLWVASLFILRSWFDWYGSGFGSIGLALAMISWSQIVAIVWIIAICGAAVWWERTATVDEVVELQVQALDTTPSGDNTLTPE